MTPCDEDCPGCEACCDANVVDVLHDQNAEAWRDPFHPLDACNTWLE